MSAEQTKLIDGSELPKAWSVGRVLLTIVWLGVTLLVGYVLVVWAWEMESEIAYGIGGDHSPLTLPFMVVVTACVLAAGPLAVWTSRRTRPWLVAAAVMAVLGLATAVPKHAAERVQDEIRAIPVPSSWRLEFGDAEGYGAGLFGVRDSATRVFSSTDDVEEACAASRTALSIWARGADVQDRQTPPDSVTTCDMYAVRDGTFVAIVVYDRVGWDRHNDVMGYDVRNPSAPAFIELTTTDASG